MLLFRSLFRFRFLCKRKKIPPTISIPTEPSTTPMIIPFNVPLAMPSLFGSGVCSVAMKPGVGVVAVGVKLTGMLLGCAGRGGDAAEVSTGEGSGGDRDDMAAESRRRR